MLRPSGEPDGLRKALSGLEEKRSALSEPRKKKLLQTILEVAAPTTGLINALAGGSPKLTAFATGLGSGFQAENEREEAQRLRELAAVESALNNLGQTQIRDELARSRQADQNAAIEARNEAQSERTLERQKSYYDYTREQTEEDRTLKAEQEQARIDIAKRNAAVSEAREARLKGDASVKEPPPIKATPVYGGAMGAIPKVSVTQQKINRAREAYNALPASARASGQSDEEKALRAAKEKHEEAMRPIADFAAGYRIPVSLALETLNEVYRGSISEQDYFELLLYLRAGQIDAASFRNAVLNIEETRVVTRGEL